MHETTTIATITLWTTPCSLGLRYSTLSSLGLPSWSLPPFSMWDFFSTVLAQTISLWPHFFSFLIRLRQYLFLSIFCSGLPFQSPLPFLWDRLFLPRNSNEASGRLYFIHGFRRTLHFALKSVSNISDVNPDSFHSLFFSLCISVIGDVNPDLFHSHRYQLHRNMWLMK